MLVCISNLFLKISTHSDIVKQYDKWIGSLKDNCN